MADINLLASATTSQANNTDQTLNVEESIEQGTYVAGVALDAGTPVYIGSDGKLAKSDANGTGTRKAIGLTVRRVAANQPVTVISKGVVFGFDFGSQAFGAEIFLSDTEGRVADAAGTTSVKVGEVIPSYTHVRGGTAKKLLRVTL